MESLAQRHVVPEQMDAPDLDASAHDQALTGLRRLNRISGAAAILARPIHSVARSRGTQRLTVLDVACGGGDVPLAMARQLRAARVHITLTLSDRSPHALALAQVAAQDAGLEASASPGTAPDDLPEGAWDIVTNSLFLHHLSRPQVVATLAAMARRARVAVVVSDLRRSVIGWAVTWLMCRLVTRSPIVHFDGPASVQAAWTVDEVRQMAQEAGLEGARVEACWPWRMLLIWEKP